MSGCGDEQRCERPERWEGSRADRHGRRHQPPACEVLETVGLGAGAELADGAGAGAELGGASVGDGDELCGLALLGALDEGAWLGEFEELEAAEEAVAGWSGRALGCTPGVVVRAVRCRRWLAEAVGDPAGDTETDGSVLGAVLTWLTAWVGAVRANRVAKPTAVTALSCVARQVSLDRRRSPVARACPGNSSMGPVAGAVMAGESRYGSPVPRVR